MEIITKSTQNEIHLQNTFYYSLQTKICEFISDLFQLYRKQKTGSPTWIMLLLFFLLTHPYQNILLSVFGKHLPKMKDIWYDTFMRHSHNFGEPSCSRCMQNICQGMFLSDIQHIFWWFSLMLLHFTNASDRRAFTVCIYMFGQLNTVVPLEEN